MDHAELLIAELAASTDWPLPRELTVRSQVHTRRAWRRGEKRTLKRLANWDVRCAELFVGGTPREYIHDPLAKRIAGAFADFLFGDAPTITAHNEKDQDWVDLIVKENRLASALHRAERVVVSESEAWWHAWTDRDVALAPLVEFVSRLRVVPLWRGDRLLAAAFVTVVAREGDVVWRHFEVHTTGVVRNVLFRGSDTGLGVSMPLDARPELLGLEEAWAHGLPMLAGRVTNELDDSHELGISEYDQIEDLLLALNEARTIGAENTRLTAKKRLFVTGELTNPDGDFDAGSDVIQVESDGGTLGEGPRRPSVAEVEYSYDAAPLIAHNQDLESTILSRVGLVPQIVGRDIDGQAESGTALRMRWLPTEIASDGKGREWDDRLPHVVQCLMLVDQLPAERGGFGRTYVEAGAPPTIVRGSVLPRDDGEVITDNAAAVSAGIRSVETAVRDQHPDWEDQDVTEEIDRIREDGDMLTPASIDPPTVVPDPEPVDA